MHYNFQMGLGRSSETIWLCWFLNWSSSLPHLVWVHAGISSLGLEGMNEVMLFFDGHLHFRIWYSAGNLGLVDARQCEFVLVSDLVFFNTAFVSAGL